MNRQTQWLFEAPFASNTTQYTTPYATPEYFSNSELTEGCQSQTSDCPPNGVASQTLSGYITHATKVPEGEKGKIRAVADNIVKNANQGSQSVRICIVGHADKDPRGENFERNISSQRAVEVMNELTNVINNPLILSKVNWKLVCAGKDNPIVPFSKPLAQRLRNRRVEIFIAASPPPKPRKEEPPQPRPEIRPLPPDEMRLCRNGKIYCATSDFIRSKSRFCNLSDSQREQAINIEFGLMKKAQILVLPDPNPKRGMELLQKMRRFAAERVDEFISTCFDIKGSKSVAPRRRTKPVVATRQNTRMNRTRYK